MSIAFSEIFLHRPAGCANCAGGFAPNGRGCFSLRFSGGDSPSADGGDVAAPAAGTTPYPRRWAKRKGHLRFPFLFELLPFPCFLIWRRFPICDRSEIRGTAEDFFFRVFRNLFAVSDTILLHMRFTFRRRDMSVSRNSFARCYGRHLRIIIDVRLYLVAPYGINRANDIRNNTR